MKNPNIKRGAQAIALLLLLLCAAALTACGKDTKKNNESAVTSTVTPAATATSTPSPTPTVPFVKQAYEQTGVENVYRLPIVTPNPGTSCMCLQVTGDYALFSVTEGLDALDESGNYPVKQSFVLARPLVSKEVCRMEPEYSVGISVLLPDGSFLMEDWEQKKVHFYDNTMTEVSACAYDKSWYLGRFLGETDEAWCFSAMNEERQSVYFYFPKTGGEAKQGGEPTGLNTAAVPGVPYGWEEMDDSSLPAVWFMHASGEPRNGIAFPKNRLRETMECRNKTGICGRGMVYPDENTEIREFRLYNLTDKTVSETISESDFPEKLLIRGDGLIGDSAVILYAQKPDDSGEMLLWVPEKTAPITGFCDFTKEEPIACLKGMIEELAQEGIEITPDPLEDDGSYDAFSEIIYEIDFACKFALARRTQPEIFADTAKIHPENMRNNVNGHYEFNPHVFSEFYVQEHGEARRQAVFNYVDALRAGEDWFECPDESAMWWCVGRLGHFFFPVGPEFTTAGVYKDGKAQILYKIPKEEFLEKEREFEKMITDIVNNAVGDDYTDLEKAVALYEFLTEYCTYDYEMLEHCTEWMDKQGGYRALIEKRGICNEFACLYQYLLMQCGVDVEESGGPSLTWGQDSHAWVYVTIDGKGYLVDPTWGETSVREPSLAYFLFTDELREKRDGFDSAKFDVAGAENSRKKYSFEATDKRFEDLWEGVYLALDHDAECIYCLDYDGNLKVFDCKTAED